MNDLPMIGRRAAIAGFAAVLGTGCVKAHAADSGLVGAAMKEGRVTWYTNLIVDMVVRPMAAAFQAAYPGIKVDYVPITWQEALIRLQNEARAGGPRADVFDGAGIVFPLIPKGLIETYHSPSAANYPSQYCDPDGYYTAISLQYMTPCINTDMVSDSNAPKTYEDLLDPKWKDRMAWTNSPSVSGPTGFIGNIMMTMGQENGMAYLKRLATQRIANVPANQRVVLDQCIAGQYPLVLCTMSFHAAASMADGAPVKWLKIAPTIETFNLMGLLKGSSHPAAGKLFVDYVLSDEGQQVMRKANYIPVAPNVPAPVANLKPDVGKFAVNTISPKVYNDHDTEWTAIYKQLFE